ncbi:YjjG family noncanonical pyrimidine nucleotidase [Parafilimonas sp.]|uniref:YjjG family noncanonical pyrimidine nucleotidase n=1 Tax=Parafilimonas sp. TaxID=1969739 RepID=UPI003F80B515
MAYKHLFFDLDHTLWDFETNAKETFQELHRLHMLHEKGIADFDAFFSRYSFHNTRLWDRYTKGYIKQEELRWKRIWLTLLDFKLADEALAKEISVQFLEGLPNRKKLFPYTTEILDYLTQKNYVLHLITNGFDNVQHSKLKHSNLTGYFKEVITSEKCGSLKPQKEIFEFALRATNADAGESIMIGDNIDADIKGAMAAGLDTIFVNHINADTDVRPTYTIHHLKELEDIF